jgi:hypothetical protein
VQLAGYHFNAELVVYAISIKAKLAPVKHKGGGGYFFRHAASSLLAVKLA